jgi:PAS domain S-box-containing protein
MTNTSPHRETPNGYAASPQWFLVSSLILLGVAIGLFFVSLGTRIYVTGFSLSVFFAALFALGCATFLHIRFFLQKQKQHRQTADAFYATDREFNSIFQHALDAILILDDAGVCLNANPAALLLLGVPRAGLVGHSLAQFYADMTERVLAEQSLRASEERFHQMANHIQEIFWLLDASTKEVLEVNLAYQTITGRSLESLRRNPTSYTDLIHGEDRVRVLAKLEEAAHSGHLDEEFRIVRPDGEVRWVWAHGFPVRDRGDGTFRLLAGTVLDITARKLADAQVAQHLIAAETAREQAEASRNEAEALRKATLALTQNLRMDSVLDTLLCCVRDLIPYDSASVILTEGESRLFVAREAPPALANKAVLTLEARENVFLERVLVERKSAFVPDTREEREWSETRALAHIHCWLCVPLVVSDSVLGLLSIGSNRPRSFTTEHFRLAKSLAIPAAVAIHNARLYEWAEIYAAERQQLLRQVDPKTPARDRDRPLSN